VHGGGGGHVHVNYIRASAVTYPYTATSDCYMIGFFNGGNNASDGVYINGVCVLRDDGDGNGQCCVAPLTKGDVITVQESIATRCTIKIAPYAD